MQGGNWEARVTWWALTQSERPAESESHRDREALGGGELGGPRERHGQGPRKDCLTVGVSSAHASRGTCHPQLSQQGEEAVLQWAGQGRKGQKDLWPPRPALLGFPAGNQLPGPGAQDSVLRGGARSHGKASGMCTAPALVGSALSGVGLPERLQDGEPASEHPSIRASPESPQRADLPCL